MTPNGSIFSTGTLQTRRPKLYLALLMAAVLTAVIAVVFMQTEIRARGGVINGFTLTSDTPGTLSMSWDTAAPPATDYRINYAKSNESYPSWRETEGNQNQTETAFTLENLDQGVSYKVRVRARYYTGEHQKSPWSGPWLESALVVSSEAPAGPDPTTEPEPAEPDPVEPEPEPEVAVPAAPSLMGSAVSSDGHVTILWQQSPADDSITGFQILRGPNTGFVSSLADNIAASSTSYVDASTSQGQTYEYGVKARNSAGLGPLSNILTVVVPEAEEDEPVLVVSRHEEEDTNDLLVSNIDQAQFRGIAVRHHNAGRGWWGGSIYGQKFRTGASQYGYNIHEIQLRIKNDNSSPSTPTVSVQIDNRNDPSWRRLVRFSADRTIANTSEFELFTFTPNARLDLQPNTHYWVVIEGGGRIMYMGTTNSDAEDAGSQSDWNLEDTHGEGTNRADVSHHGDAIRVRIKGHEIERSYTVEPDDIGDDTSTAGRVTVDGDAVEGRFHQNDDDDWYRVTLSAEDHEVRVRGPHDYRIAVHDSSGASIASVSRRYWAETPGSGKRLHVSPSTAGTHYVSVSPSPSGAALPEFKYTMSVATDEDVGLASRTASEPGTITPLQLTHGGDTDYTKFNLKANVRYQAILHVGPNNYQAILPGIYDSAQNQISGQGEVRGSSLVRRSFTPSADGVYQFAAKASGDDFGGSDAYLGVWSAVQSGYSEPTGEDLPDVNMFTKGYLPTDGTTITGEIGHPGDVDWFAIWLNENERVRLRGYLPAGETSNDLDGKLEIKTFRYHNQSRTSTEQSSTGSARTASDKQCVDMSYGLDGRSGTGIYWIAVSAHDGGTGHYELESSNDIACARPAEGYPLILGNHRVGETLTVSTDGITDPDGLTSPTYTYQWQRLDDGVVTDITGETTDSYTLTNDDFAKRIQMQVEFDDDENNPELLTGPATSGVSGEPKFLFGNFNKQAGTEVPEDVSTGFTTGSQFGYIFTSVKTNRTASANHASTSEFRLHRLTTNSTPVITSRASYAPSHLLDAIYRNLPRVVISPNTKYHAAAARTQGGPIGCRGANPGIHSNSLAGFSFETSARPYNPVSAGGYGRACLWQFDGYELAAAVAVERIEITSMGTHDGMYIAGDVIEATVVLNGAAAPDGPVPTLMVKVGSNLREMIYSESKSTPTSWVFHYTVVAADRDDDGVEFPKNSLHAYADADISFTTIKYDRNRPESAVNARPRLVDYQVTSTPVAPGYYGPGEQIEFTFTFSLPVTVTGDPEMAFNMDTGEDREYASYARGSGTREIVFAYTVTTTDEDESGIWWPRDSIRLDSDDSIVGTYNNLSPSSLNHGERGTIRSHKVDQNPRPLPVRFTSVPTRGSNSDYYYKDDAIVFELEFNQDVITTNYPRMRFSLGGVDIYAVYGFTTGRVLTFLYLVEEDDDDNDGIWLYGENFLDLNTNPLASTIVGANNSLPAEIGDVVGPSGAQSGHKVDGSQGGIN